MSFMSGSENMDEDNFILNLHKGIFENEKIKIEIKDQFSYGEAQTVTEWSISSPPDKNGHVNPNGNFGAKPVMSLRENVLSVSLSVETDINKIETTFYLCERGVAVEKEWYSGIFIGERSWTLKTSGNYSVVIFIHKKGTDYTTADIMSAKQLIYYKPLSLTDLILSDKEKQTREDQRTRQRRLYETIISAATVGVDVFAYFKELGFAKVALYSESYLGVLVYRMAYYKEHYVDILSNDDYETKTYQDLIYFSKVNVKHWGSVAHRLDESTAILVLDVYNYDELDRLKEIVKATAFDAMQLFTQLLFNKTVINPALEFHLTCPGVKIMILSDYYLDTQGETSEHEKNLNGFLEYVNTHCDDPSFNDPIFTAHGKKSDYIKNTIPSSFYDECGISRLLNSSGDYLNVINNFRVTHAVPRQYKNTIWMMGSSNIIGVYSADWETIPSYLQLLLNSNEISYSVVNCGSYWGGSDEQQWRLAKLLPIENGDIIISHVHRKVFDELAKHFDYCDVRKLFSRPHNFGEIYVDEGHVNYIGNKVIAKALFDRLTELNYFDNTMVSNQITPVEKTVSTITLLNNSENSELAEYISSLSTYSLPIGAIVMNCNPFTNGHRYLVEYAASRVKHLYIFIVEEDKYFFSFADRIELVKKGTADISNVTVIPGGKYIISQRTFAAYSSKENIQNITVDPSLDINIFARHIAPALNITIRFAGEEPLDNITRQYNDAMRRILPRNGVSFEVINRIEHGGKPVSASRVRELLKTKNYHEISKLVPATTLEYLKRKFPE